MGEVFTVLLDIAALSILEERGLSSEEPLLLHEGSAVWDGLSHLYIIFYEAFYTVIQEGEMKELSPTNFINKYECPAEQKESFLNVLKGYTSEVEWSELALPPTAPLLEAANSKEDRPSSIGTSAPRSPLHIIRDQWGESPSFVKVSSALSDGFARSAVDWESLSKTVEREFLPVYKRLKRSYAESVSLFYLTWSDFQKSKLPIAFKFSVLVLYCEMLLSGGPINQPALYKLLLESFKALGEDRLAHGSFPFVLLLNQLTLKFVLVYDMHVLVVWELFQQSPHKERILAAYNAVCRTKGCEAAVRLFGRFLEYTKNSEEGNVLSLFVKSLSELLDTHIKPTGPVPGHIQYLLSSTFLRCTTAYLHSLDTTPSVEALDVMRHGVRILNVMSILCDYVFIPERRAHRQAKRCVTVGPTFPSEQASNGGGSSLSPRSTLSKTHKQSF
ncbi:hypothetical protein ADEAN_000330800 [Angomonas deanei]|uniref:Uncharacterized protein n=1 Tax=Angomonas deanei TaxID=59799 RepID=A0A7G2C7Q0_9TRYP|nr:hypothetical protein ADEAN_000330800 [Angomonas deanei]